MDWLSDLLRFIWAVINTWAGYATGGIVVAILALWSTLRNKPTSRKIALAAAAVFLLLACFDTWRAEYKKTQTGFRLSIDDAGFAETLTGDNGQQIPGFGSTVGSPAIIVATLSNLGIPSIADGWNLTIRLPQQQEPVTAQMMVFAPEVQTIEIGGKIKILVSDILYKQTLSPVATGDKKQGLIPFFVPGLTMSDLARKGTTFTLTCHDIAGNTISAQLQFTGHQDAGWYYWFHLRNR